MQKCLDNDVVSFFFLLNEKIRGSANTQPCQGRKINQHLIRYWSVIWQYVSELKFVYFSTTDLF